MSDAKTNETYDVAVVGAGVVGCAIARKFTLEGARVIVLEKARDILDGASKANSAILHTGFDAPVGSLEWECIQEGYRQYEKIHEKLNLPIDRCGALVLAWDDAQEAKLPDLMAQARANSVHDVQLLSKAELLALEPELSGHVKAGFRVPGESLIDPWSSPHGYLLQALLNGATLWRDAEVLGGQFDGATWTLETSQGWVEAAHVVNAAGLYGDVIDQRLLGCSDFKIRPRKGQFVVYDKSASQLAKHILLPVPTETTKGIVVCRTIWGNLLVGPTAEAQTQRDVADLVPKTLAALHEKGCEILPNLAAEEITTTYAGLRPATDEKEYQIRAHPENMVTVGGIRSTGLSSALGIAEYVTKLFSARWNTAEPIVWPKMAMLAEAETRPWQQPVQDGIVCHCERVTRREIDTALSGPLGAQTLAGLKRRTRVTMGRCQGFYCSAEIEKISGFVCSRKVEG